METAQVWAEKIDFCKSTVNTEGLGRICLEAHDVKFELLKSLGPSLGRRIFIRPTAWDPGRMPFASGETSPLYVESQDPRTLFVGGKLIVLSVIVAVDLQDGILGRGRRIIQAERPQGTQDWRLLQVSDEFKGRGWKTHIVEEAVKIIRERFW